MRSLAYDRAQGILLSAGFEFAIRAWALIGSASYPLFTLVGHALPVRAKRRQPQCCSVRRVRVRIELPGRVWNEHGSNRSSH